MEEVDLIAKEFLPLLNSLTDKEFERELAINAKMGDFLRQNLYQVRDRERNIQKVKETGKPAVTTKELTYKIKLRIDNEDVVNYIKTFDDYTLMHYYKINSVKKTIDHDEELKIRYDAIVKKLIK